MKNYPELVYLARAYFHQDCIIPVGEPLGALRDFLEHETGEIKYAVLNDIDQAISELTEHDAKGLWLQNGDVVFDPTSIGIPCLEWFSMIGMTIRKGISS
ncbi:contact-dependent growth inhibition system immunity protein [Kitasatospora sp. NPDC059817]|uniref:contact-dependent growth inhibition system immunity protein n=1 Tax=unclassified Kitasatospora TaxID=2633591 RepID=UPI00364D4983